MEFAVKTTQLAKAFSGREVLRDCSLAVERGTVYGLLGRNGAGKTTLFKLLLGYLKPAMGKAEVLGMDSVRDNREILRRTGSLIEAPVFYEHLSAEENLRIHLAYMEMPGKTICSQEQENSRRQKIREQNIQQRIEEVLDLSGLPCTGEQPVGTFSLGMRQRLAIARAVVHRPELLILDEPMNGLDPAGIREMRELLKGLMQKQKMTILLSSHMLPELEQTADWIGILAGGKIAAEGTPRELAGRCPGGLEEYFIRITKEGRHDA